MWQAASIFAIFSVFSLYLVSAQFPDDDVVMLVRLPANQIELDSNDEFPVRTAIKEELAKRAIPFNGGMYGKRSVMPFSGGMYGKRAHPIVNERRAVMPFSGGMYGKRSSYSSQNDNYIKRGGMPFSGGMYGR